MRRPLVALGFCAALTAACGDSVDPVERAISAEDAALIMQEVGRAAIDGFNDVFPGPGSPSGPTTPAASGVITLPAGHVHSCSGGGAINVGGFVQGFVDDATQAGRLDVQIDLQILGCTATGNGKELTITATPLVTLSGDVLYRDGLPDGPQAFGMGGGFRWVDGDGGSGLCSIEFIVDWTDAGSSISGSACGWRIDLDF